MSSEPTRQSRILVVDDEQTIALTLSAILKEEGYDVAVAFNGEKAVGIASEYLPDLVLSDINMGALNGLEAAVRILANQPNCRVLFLTGQPGLIDIFDPPQENLAYSLMVKPVRIPDLLSATAYMLPPATKANDQAALKIEHDCMELQTLARTAIARLDARRTVGGEDPRQALGQGTTSDATRRCTEITGQPTGIAAIEELWFRLRKRPVQDTRKALSLLRAALLA